METEAEIGGLWPQQRYAHNYRKLERSGNKSLPASGGSTALLTPWLRPREADGEFLASTTVRQYIPPVYGNLYGNYKNLILGLFGVTEREAVDS